MDGEDESKLHGIPEGDHEHPVDAAHVSNLVLDTDVEPKVETPKLTLPRLFKREKAKSTEDPRPSVAGKVVTNVATFHDVFGILGIPTVIVLLLSAAWTFMLAAIQVNADRIVNSIMSTTEFDNGDFRLLPQPDTGLVVSSTVLLLLFGVGYFSLAMMMLFFNRFKGAHKSDNHEKVATDPNTVSHASDNAAAKTWQRVLHWLHHKFDLPLEIRQRYILAMLDLLKLIFQTLPLLTYLRRGFPTAIIYYYAVLLLCNWLMACYRNQRCLVDQDLIIARLHYTFDLFFAVFAPLVVLIYFIQSFHFDRAAFMTKLETIGPGTFDTVARIFGDPAQISSFCNAFHYLQFSSGTTLFYKSALNVLSLYKWHKITRTLIHNHHERQLLRQQKALVQPELSESSRTGSLHALKQQIAAVATSKPKIGKHFVPKLFLSLVFLAAGVFTFVYSIGSVRSSTDLCNKYDKCVIVSYQWNFGQKDCTCLVFADRQTKPTTYAEWTNPVDTTQNLAELAVAGELRIVQIINRAVPALPEELRGCRYLEQMILAYTKTEALPEWFSEFSHLQYLHIEADFTSRRLKTVPQGTFDNMPNLMFLHLGGIASVEELPSLSALTNLRYLALAVLSSLKEFPSFEGLSKVTDLTIVNAPLPATLPSLAPLVKLKTLAIRARSAVCCNGYIRGACNMTESQCLPLATGNYPLTCTEERASAADMAKFASFGNTICPNSPAVDREATAPSRYSTDELCGGVNYKSCILNGVQGKCYNMRMMVITCVTDASYMAMRKLQIQRGVGEACDPTLEAWLGCS